MKAFNYQVAKIEDIEHLRQLFPEGEADELNFVLFSTSGAHGSYETIEDIEASLASGECEEDDCSITILVVRPRVVTMQYGSVKISPNDFPYLKKLRKSSWKAVHKIGRGRR